MKKKRIISLGIIALFLLLWLFDVIKIPLFCPIYQLTHLYCPGCGITRMLKSLLRGHFYQAFRYNPLVFLTLPFALLYVLDQYIAFQKHKKAITSHLEPYLWYILIVIFIVYGILRNVPYFDFLKPTPIS